MSEKTKPNDNEKPPWTVGLYKITPEMAQQMLQNNYVNRPPNAATIARYQGDMLANLWKEPTVIYRTHGKKTMDGQHRLAALVAARKSYWFVIIDDVDPDLIDCIDGGARRSDLQRLVM